MSAGPIGLFDVREEVIARSRAGDALEQIEHDLIDPRTGRRRREGGAVAARLVHPTERRGMPQIIVTSNAAERGPRGEVMYREWVNAVDFESAHFRAQLLERLGWAIGDAHAAEGSEPPSTDTPAADDGVADPATLAGAYDR